MIEESREKSQISEIYRVLLMAHSASSLDKVVKFDPLSFPHFILVCYWSVQRSEMGVRDAASHARLLYLSYVKSV